MGTVRNLKQLSGRLVSDIRRLEANWSIPSSSTGLSFGTRDNPLVLDDEEDEVVVRVEREDTVVPPPRAGTPFVARATMVTTLIEIDKDDVDPNDVVTDQSIDVMEDQFMILTGVMVHRGRRIAWPPLDLEDDKVVVSLVVGEGEEAEIVRDFAGEEEQQRLQDLDDAALFKQSATLQHWGQGATCPVGVMDMVIFRMIFLNF